MGSFLSFSFPSSDRWRHCVGGSDGRWFPGRDSAGPADRPINGLRTRFPPDLQSSRRRHRRKVVVVVVIIVVVNIVVVIVAVVVVAASIVDVRAFKTSIVCDAQPLGLRCDDS